MILLKANKSLNTVFKKMIHTMEEDITWTGTFIINNNDIILVGEKESLFLSFDNRYVLSRTADLAANETRIELVGKNLLLENTLNIILYTFGKWGEIKGLTVEKDYDELNRLLNNVLAQVDVSASLTRDNLRFFQKGILSTYEDVIQTILDQSKQQKKEQDGTEDEKTDQIESDELEESEDSIDREDYSLGLWHNVKWDSRKDTFKKVELTSTEREKLRLGNNFYPVNYICPDCGDKLFMVVYPTGKEFRIETDESPVYMARAYTCLECHHLYTPKPHKLLVEGDVYHLNFEEDKVAYEDYLELLGRQGERTSNSNLNFYESEYNKKDELTREENQEEENLAEENLEEDELQTKKGILEKKEKGNHRISWNKANQERKKNLGREELLEKKTPETKENRNSQKKKFSRKDSQEREVSQKKRKSHKKKHILEREGTQEKKSIQEENEFQEGGKIPREKRDLVTRKVPGEKSILVTRKVPGEKSILVTRKVPGEKSILVTGKVLEKKNILVKEKSLDNRNTLRIRKSLVQGQESNLEGEKSKNFNNIRVRRKTGQTKKDSLIKLTLVERKKIPDNKRTKIRTKQKPLKGKILSFIERAELGKEKSYASNLRLLQEVEKENLPEGEKEQVLKILLGNLERSGTKELKNLMQNLPETMSAKQYMSYRNKMEQYKEADISRFQNLLEGKRDESERREIKAFIRKANARTRKALSDLYHELETQDFTKRNLSKYLEDIHDKIYDIDQSAIHRICPNPTDLTFEEGEKIYEEIREGDFLPELKTNILSLIDQRLKKLKMDECQKLVEKFRKSINWSEEEYPRIYLYNDKKDRKEENDNASIIIKNALNTYATGRGKYEYPIFVYDTSQRGNGKKGFVLTPEHIFYKNHMESDTINVMNIKEILLDNKLLKRGIYAQTQTSKRIRISKLISCGDLKFFGKAFNEFISYLKEKPESRSISYLAKEKHTVICCYRCGHIYKDSNICPKCGSKNND